MRILSKLTVRNFKSIREQCLQLGPLNIFIGANGAGKSNLIQAFRLLRELTQGNLGLYSLQRGADSLLHFGRKGSPFLEFELEFGDPRASDCYQVRLTPTADDALIIQRESVVSHDKSTDTRHYNEFPGGSRESRLHTDSTESVQRMRADLASTLVYHFHDTSDNSPIRSTCDLDDNRVLRADASNLPAFLYFLKEREPAHFRNVEDVIREIAPFFDGFQLAPSRLKPDKIRLEWKEKGRDSYFNATALSDGTLRFICLATLLLQPQLPTVILLDEPELGLHPAAITLLAGLLSSAASRTQVIVATQSVTLVNQFGPEEIWTVDRQGTESVFRPLSQQKDVSDWLDGYSLGELWEKNVLGARP